MVLEFKIPHGYELIDLKPLLPKFFTYLFSFFYVGIYWNNHHHLWQAVEKVSGKILWANLHLLFWLSMFPFATGWMGENNFRTYPVAVYGFILLMASIAWYILANIVKKEEGEHSTISKAYKKDTKTQLSILTYAIATGLSFLIPVISVVLYLLIAIVWFIPDKRIEKTMKNK